MNTPNVFFLSFAAFAISMVGFGPPFPIIALRSE